MSEIETIAKQTGLKLIDGKIRIGCIDYKISVVETLEDEEGNEIYGQCAYDTCEIFILSRLADDAKRCTLWHEILHAVLVNAGFVGEHDEQMVAAIANGLLSLLIDANLSGGRGG